MLCIMELYLNQEPLDSNPTSEVKEEPTKSSNNGPEILERFKHIQAVTARANERRRQKLSSVQGPVMEQNVCENKRGFKRSHADLVAEALELEEAVANKKAPFHLDQYVSFPSSKKNVSLG